MSKEIRFVFYNVSNEYEFEYLVGEKGFKYLVDFDPGCSDNTLAYTVRIDNTNCKYYILLFLKVYHEVDRFFIEWFVQQFSLDQNDLAYAKFLSNDFLDQFNHKTCLGIAFLLSGLNFPVSAGKIFKYLKHYLVAGNSLNIQKHVRKFMYDFSDNHYLLCSFYIEKKAYLIKQANFLYKENQFLEASIYLEQIVEYHKDKNYSIKLFLSYVKLMQYRKAEEFYSQFTKEQKAKSQVARGYLSLVQMNYIDALEHYTLAIKEHPANNISWSRILLQVCMKLFKDHKIKWEEIATQNGLNVASRKEFVNLIAIRIDLLISLGKEKEAIKESSKIAGRLRPDFFKAYENLFTLNKKIFYKSILKLKNKIDLFGNLILFLRNKNKGSSILIKLDTYMISLKIALGRCYLLDMDLLKAKEVFSQLYGKYKEPRALEWLAYTNYCLTEYRESLTQYQLVLDAKPNRVPVVLQIIRIYTELELYDHATEYMNIHLGVLEKSKNKDKSHLARRNLYYLTKDFRKAWLVFRDRNINALLSLDHTIHYVQDIFSLKTDDKIFILAEWGPGDEVRWASTYPELEERFHNLIIGCDPRLEVIFQRSFPNIKFYPINKKIRGRVLPEIYETVNHVSHVTLTQVFDNKSYDFATKQDAVTLISDVLGECRYSTNQFITHNGILIVDNILRNNMMQWIESLPKNKLNIGICWKSGLIDPMRSIHYSELDLWGDILLLENVNFINLQYSNYEDDIDKVYQKFGVKIHSPNIDLRDDFDSVAALMDCLDIVISPATAVAELAGMVGVKTLLFTNSVEVDWRVLPDDIDLWHSSIKHIRADRGLTKEAAQKSIVQKISYELRKNLL